MCADKVLCKRGFGADVLTLPGRPVSFWEIFLSNRTVWMLTAVGFCVFFLLLFYVGQQHPEEKDMERTLHKLEELTLPLFSVDLLIEVRRINREREKKKPF